MKASDVSIIIPIYATLPEHVTWLQEAVESALKQNGAEVIVCDDGSTEKFSIYNKSVTLLRIQHAGVSTARNTAIAAAQTELILPLDGDDRLKPGAVDALLNMWNGVPVYPDVAKIGDEVVPHYVLLDWDCSHLTNYVGFCSVNVLHSKEQWKAVGGYDSTITFYEDGEYNARLLGNYCAVHCRQPLVEYRMHKNQRTKTQPNQVEYAKRLLERIRRYTMACAGCGGARRRTPSLNQPASFKAKSVKGSAERVSINNVTANLPLMFEGRVLAVYIGGQGKAKHYYRGFKTHTNYRVTYGEAIYAKPEDTKDEADQMSPSLLVRVKRQEAPAPQPVQIVVEPAAPVASVTNVVNVVKKPTGVEVARTARKVVNRTPKND